MEELYGILLVASVLILIFWGIRTIIRSATHVPTWSGIIISALLGMLPLYLILCFFGIMGEERYNAYDEAQSQTGNYAEEMSKRYAYKKSSRKGGCITLVVLTFIVMCLLYVVLYYNSNKQVDETPIETIVYDNVGIEEQKKEIPPVVKKKSSAKKKQETKSESTNAVQEEIIESKPNVKEKSTQELLEERNHASVVRQAKEDGVSTEGSTSDILNRIIRKNLEQDM